MMLSRRMSLFLIPFILFSLFSPGYSYKKLKAFVLVPPGQVLPGVRRIAVLDFESRGDYGRRFSDMLISKLIKKDRGIHAIATGFLGMGGKREGKSLQEGTFTNIFEVVERSQLMQVLNEQKLSASGLLDQNQAASLGKILGVDAIVMGNVTFNSQTRDFQEERTYTKNKKKYKRLVNCRKREVNATVQARIIGTESAQILGSTSATRSLASKKCENDIANLPSVDQMLNQVLGDLSEEVANYLAPHYVLQSYEFEKIKTKPFDKLGNKAAKLAEKLKVDKAYIIYKSIYDKDAYNPKVLYNLGILNEVVGNFDKALEFYQMAYQLDEEGKYEKAIERVKKNLEFTDALKQMGVEIKAHQFIVSQEKLAQMTAKKVRVKGKREQRVNVYAEPREGTEVVARVPGGVSFPVIAREGNFFKIKLLGGKEGYIRADKVEMK